MLVRSRVKYIQSLSQKKFRDEEGVFVAEGPKIINDLLAGQQAEATMIFALKSWIKPTTIGSYQSLIEEIADTELQRISFLSAPNQVIGVFKKPVFNQTVDASKELVLMLDEIQDPGNMGTIIRCADWFGVRQIICNAGSADAFSPKVVQSSMGSVSRVEVVIRNLEEFIEQHPQLRFYAAALGGRSMNDFDKIDKGVLLIGNESRGISESLLAKITERIAIPKRGHAESLNAAVATGILLSNLLAE